MMNYLKTHMECGNLKEKPAGNSRFAKAGVSCFYESEVLNSRLVHLMKFSAKNPHLTQSRRRKNIDSKINRYV